DLEIPESRLDDGRRAGDLVPGDGDAEPRIVRAPSADSDQYIWHPFAHKGSVELCHSLRRLDARSPVEAEKIDNDQIVDAFEPSIAHHVRAAAQKSRGLHIADLELLAFPGQGEG